MKSEEVYRKLLEEILPRLNECQIVNLMEELEEGTLKKEFCRILEEDSRFFQNDFLDMDKIKEMLKRELDTVRHSHRGFFEELIYFADRAKMTDAQVYNAIGMNRTLWYRLRDNPNAKTSKRNVLKLAIILKLDYWEMYYLLNLAGYSLLPGDDGTDKIVSFCIRRNIYDCRQIDELFFEAGEEPLFSEQ